MVNDLLGKVAVRDGAGWGLKSRILISSPASTYAIVYRPSAFHRIEERLRLKIYEFCNSSLKFHHPAYAASACEAPPHVHQGERSSLGVKPSKIKNPSFLSKQYSNTYAYASQRTFNLKMYPSLWFFERKLLMKVFPS
jgi:hypothetical protein